MTSKLKAKAEKRVREIADATVWSGDMRVNMTTVVGALRCAVKMLDEERAARLAADEQQAERIATLERDEARAEYARLYDRFDLVIQILELNFPKRPEWRKGGT